MKKKPCLGGIFLSYNYGFYITALVLKGKNKNDAKIILNQGLNVISGASNTGKTYIFECINYIFGSRDKPKAIDEAKGYSDVLLEIQSYQGKEVTLKRSLIDKKMYLYDCGIDRVNEIEPESIKQKHDKDDAENISSILLEMCGADYRNVIKNKTKGYTESFTFRDFVHLTMLSEKHIISSLSPIYTDGKRVKKTRDESVFKTVMIGLDDSVCEDNKDNDSNKVKVEAKIDLIDGLIINIRSQIQELEDTKISNGDIQDSIINLQEEIKEKSSQLEQLEIQRKDLWESLQKNKNDRILSVQLKKRFELLRKNYESDLQRLDFIDEAEYYLNQLIDIRCPICNSKWDNEIIDPEINNDELKTALEVEKGKVVIQLQDLLSTIDDITVKILSLEKEINDIEQNITLVDNTMQNELNPIISINISKLDQLLQSRDQQQKKEYSIERLNELEKTKQQLIESLNETITNNPVVGNISDSIYEKFVDLIENILCEWKFEESINIEFDKDIMDIVLNDKPKSSFGKGYCAILNSAFVLAVMEYCITTGLPHPKLIVLDSPLTTYKEKDLDNQEDDTIIEKVKNLFYEHLSSFSQGVQIIILDNVVPSDDVAEKITHHHFSKNPLVGRYGFIPLG